MKLGADPELFLVDAAGAFVSAIGKIGGSKMEPRPLPLGEGFAVQEDNVALEYNIPPASHQEEFVKNIQSATKFLADHIAEMGLQFSHESATYFPEDQLKDPAAQVFGCDPDYNAWTGEVNPKPQADNPTLRSCGGHVHVGHNTARPLEAVKRMDLMLAVPSVLMDNGQLRKKLYGKAGAFRPKPYGFEYRVLSNFWTLSAERLRWVWNNTRLALESEFIDVDAEKDAILEAVNNNNTEAAQYLINKFNIPVTYA